MFGGGGGGEAGGLAFEGVRYGWTNQDGQTVLEVQGDVVNTSSSPVDVPTVVIALRDESGAEISEWTTEVGEQELAALALTVDRCGRSGVRRLLAQPLDRLDPLAGGSGRHRRGSLPKSYRSGRMRRGASWGQKAVQMLRIGDNPS